MYLTREEKIAYHPVVQYFEKLRDEKRFRTDENQLVLWSGDLDDAPIREKARALAGARGLKRKLLEDLEGEAAELQKIPDHPFLREGSIYDVPDSLKNSNYGLKAGYIPPLNALWKALKSDANPDGLSLDVIKRVSDIASTAVIRQASGRPALFLGDTRATSFNAAILRENFRGMEASEIYALTENKKITHLDLFLGNDEPLLGVEKEEAYWMIRKYRLGVALKKAIPSLTDTESTYGVKHPLLEFHAEIAHIYDRLSRRKDVEKELELLDGMKPALEQHPELLESIREFVDNSYVLENLNNYLQKGELWKQVPVKSPSTGLKTDIETLFVTPHGRRAIFWSEDDGIDPISAKLEAREKKQHLFVELYNARYALGHSIGSPQPSKGEAATGSKLLGKINEFIQEKDGDIGGLKDYSKGFRTLADLPILVGEDGYACADLSPAVDAMLLQSLNEIAYLKGNCHGAELDQAIAGKTNLSIEEIAGLRRELARTVIERFFPHFADVTPLNTLGLSDRLPTGRMIKHEPYEHAEHEKYLEAVSKLAPPDAMKPAETLIIHPSQVKNLEWAGFSVIGKSTSLEGPPGPVVENPTASNLSVDRNAGRSV